MKEIIEIDAVVKQLQEGLIGEETRGMVLRTVTTALSCQLVSSVDELQKQMNRISSLNNHLITRFEETILPLIQADTVSVDELFNYITTIQKNQVAIGELYRKIIQSPNSLFPDNLMSEEERKVIQLFKSFKTQAQRKKFMELVEKTMTPEVESFELPH